MALGQGSENFQVAIRVRPPLGREGSGRSFAVKSVPLLGVKGGSGEQISIQTSAGSAGRSERKEFVFSRVFGEADGNKELFDGVAAPLLDFIRAGSGEGAPRSATLFAYGQTGSGKTHTVSGHEDGSGVIPRLVEELYQRCTALHRWR